MVANRLNLLGYFNISEDGLSGETGGRGYIVSIRDAVLFGEPQQLPCTSMINPHKHTSGQ